MEANGQLVAVRATVHLPGLPLGSVALVDPADPYIAERIESGFLERIETAGSAASEPTP